MRREPQDENSRVCHVAQGLLPQAEKAARRAGLPKGCGPDVVQDTIANLLLSASRRPGFFAAMSAPDLRRYVCQSLSNTAVNLARASRLWRREPGGPDEYAPSVANDTKAAEVGFAKDLLGRLRSSLPDEAIFAINTMISGEDPSSRSKLHGVSERTGRRWFAKGVSLAAAAIGKALGSQLGNESFKHFLELCRWTRELQPGPSGLLPGSLSYRNRVHLLPRAAKRIVFLFEEGEPLDAVIDDIAWRNAPSDRRSLTHEDRKGAEDVLVDLIKDIRAVLCHGP